MIHKYSLLGRNIAVDVASGAVHELDGCAYDVLDHFPQKNADGIIKILSDKYAAGDIAACIGELNELTEKGLLFSEDAAPPAEPSGERIVKALCIHAAHDCNLSCAYCFAVDGGYRGERGLMPLETGIAAVDFLIKNSGRRKNLEIDFFGGEPLLNFGAVKKITLYCREMERAHNKRFRFTLTTNGVLLNGEAVDFIEEHMDNVVLSLDGRKEINDRMRRRAGGKGSYELVLPKFMRLVEKRRENYFIRGTYTRHNMDFTEDVRHLADLGFKYISVEPAASVESEEYALKLSDADALCAEYERLAAYVLKTRADGKPIEFFHFNIDLEGGPCIKKRVTGCGAGREYLAVAPDGKLYPCHQFAGMDDFVLGDVFNDFTDGGVREKFYAYDLFSKPACADCWAKYYCGGGCAANARNIGGDMDVPYELGCVLHRKRCECAIMLKAACN